MMSNRRLRRCLTASFVMLSLLFSQFAMASYVCPGQNGDGGMAQMMAAGEPCEGMDTMQSSLCHQHSVNAPQSVDLVKVVAPTLPAIVQVLLVPMLLEAANAQALRAPDRPQARPPPNPVFLATQRLRV